MQPSQPNKKKNGLDHLKYLIATLALAVTVGLWNFFSDKTSSGAGITSQGTASSGQGSSVTQPLFPPLPTLIPLEGQVNSPTGNQPVNNQPSSGLRQVGIPTPWPTMDNSNTKFDFVVINTGGGGDSGNSGGGGGAATSTRSSR